MGSIVTSYVWFELCLFYLFYTTESLLVPGKKYFGRSVCFSCLSSGEGFWEGRWVKFISGASNQDTPLIRNLCYLYTVAGVDCIDLCADPSVLSAVNQGVHSALQNSGTHCHRPFLMVSVNDDNDLHFRKAFFKSDRCPTSCPRPCERVCPASAILPRGMSTEGVVADKCYGCGRCISVCPLGLIEARPYTTNRQDLALLLATGAVDGLEVHTGPGHQPAFRDMWRDVGEAAARHLKVLSVSLPDMGEETVPFMNDIQGIMDQHAAWRTTFSGVQLWQTDGRPMSGDIGRGTAHAAVDLAISILDASASSPPSSDGSRVDFASGRHFVQLAGGTNDYSAQVAQSRGLWDRQGFGGFAFGGYARKWIGQRLGALEQAHPGARVEEHEEVLLPCLHFAQRLVGTVKGGDYSR